MGSLVAVVSLASFLRRTGGALAPVTVTVTLLLGLAPVGAVDDAQAAEARPLADEPSEPEARALLDRAFSNLYAEDYIQTLVLATQLRGGGEMQRRLQITRLQSVRPGKALLRFLYPQEIRRTSVLILENEEGSDDLYVYLPAVKLTRHLSNAQRKDSFFGTDLSYEDVEPKHVDDYEVRWLEEPIEDALRAAAREHGCRLVEIRAAPGFESAYERQVSCIEPERGIIVWSDFYIHGRVAKRLTVDPKQVRRVGDRYIPFLITVETPRQRSITRVVTEQYDLRAEIDDRLFSTWNLAAGDAKGDRQRTEPAPAVSAPPVHYEGE